MKSIHIRVFLGLSLTVIGILLLLINIIHLPYVDIYLLAAILVVLAILFARKYLTDDRKWWAVIPAGALFSIATVIILDGLDLLSRKKQLVVFLMGLSLTFFYLWTRRSYADHLKWSIYPAAAIGLAAIILYFGGIHRLDVSTVVALVIVGWGAWLLYKALRS